MRLRRALAGAASGLLLLVLLWKDDPGRLRRRGEILLRSARLDSDTRRLNGTATSFDRPFYVFLESARRRLPPGTPGVAILGPPASSSAVYLAAYNFAPIPVLVAPPAVPPGWLLAVYGSARPAGWRVISPVWRGVLMAPS